MTIIADGGITGGNPGGHGYGSFICEDFDDMPPQRRKYGHKWRGYEMTSILAECLTCLQALVWLREVLPESSQHPRDVQVVIRCDCQWVVGHLESAWGRSRRPHLRLVHRLWLEEKRCFASVSTLWHDRSFSVEALGH